jgi:hypothetical protein
MAIRIQLFDGSILEFPDNTSQDVVDRVAKQETLARQPAPQPRPVIEPPKRVCWALAALPLVRLQDLLKKLPWLD